MFMKYDISSKHLDNSAQHLTNVLEKEFMENWVWSLQIQKTIRTMLGKWESDKKGRHLNLIEFLWEMW